MKNTFQIILILCVIIISGCSKNLDIQPTGSLDATVALKTSDDVKVALVGTYADLGSSNLYGGTLFVEQELIADFNELNWSGTYEQLTQAKNKALTVENTFIASNWLDGYTVINDVNNILSVLDVVDDADKAGVEGEAKFIRGSLYFDLVRVFGKSWNDGDPQTNLGVPIVLQPTKNIDESSQVARNTVSEVYAQAITDLTEAEANLPAQNGVYANKAAAAGMLARIYLQQDNYAEAANAANRAINYGVNNGVKLTANYADAFSESNSTEDIFAMQVTTSSGNNSFQTYFSSSSRGDIQIENAHLNMYDPADDRLNLFYEDGGSTYTGKFEYLYGSVHIMRLAEMYLIRAEANFRAGTTIGAKPVDDINLIRNRVHLTSYAEADLTLDKILLERKLELAFEGFALQDKKRTKQGIGNLAWNDPKLVFPVPQREIRVNNKLTQNEGYGQ